MNNKTYKAKGRQGLGTAGRICKKNKKLAAKRVRNGKSKQMRLGD